jgi:hydroxyacylglutathione hydrolase
MLAPERPLLLVLENDAQLTTVLNHFARTRFDRIAGYLAGGMSAWENAGYEPQSLAQLHVKELAARNARTAEVSVLDVRSPQEWVKGHVPGARHIFLPDLPGPLGTLDKAKPTVVYCDSGYPSSTGASLEALCLRH